MGAALKEETIFPRKLAKVLVPPDYLSISVAAMFLMFSFFLDVSIRVMFKVSISKPKNVISCVGTNIDFVGCIANPSSCNRDIVESTLSKHS